MSARRRYGQRRVHVTPEVIEAWLVNEKAVVTDLPEDARFVRMYPTDEGRGYCMVFESYEWPERTEGEQIPLFEVELEEPQWKLKVEK
jgi:hypothetical protein